jgi:transcription antitermination factor NusA-like protein
MLCASCQKKIKSGEVSETYLKTARIFQSIEKEYPSLQKVFLYNAVEADNFLAVVVGRGDIASLLSHGGRIIRDFGKKMGKKIRVLEYGVDDRKFLEDLFAPLSIITINTIWLPDGTIDTRVILRKERRRPSQRDIKALKEIAKEINGITLRVEFRG